MSVKMKSFWIGVLVGGVLVVAFVFGGRYLGFGGGMPAGRMGRRPGMNGNIGSGSAFGSGAGSGNTMSGVDAGKNLTGSASGQQLTGN